MPIGSASPNSQLTSEAARYLVIVARDQPDLWRYLTQNIAEFGSVEVLLDRRYAGRWQWTQMREMQQRGADRRARTSVDSDLRSRAFVIVPQDGVPPFATREQPEL